MKIYFPNDEIYNKCYEVIDTNTIRAYDTIPQLDSTYSYRDYYIHSDYMFRDSVGYWSNDSILPICLEENIITHDYFYRVDLSHIFVIFFIMFFFIIVLPLYICRKFFYRR